MDRKIRWGVLGCANIAKTVVIPSLLKADNAVLYAVASRTEDKLEGFKCFNAEKYYASYEALLDDPLVDAVYIPLPNGHHCAWTINACEKKKHVLCEKPMGMNAAEVRRMQTAAESNHVVLMEAFAYLHSPLMVKIKEVVQSGVIGRVNYVQSAFSFILNDRANVRMIRAIGGGAVYDLGCYTVSFAREIFDEEPVNVNARATIGKESGVDEDVAIDMTFPSGMKVSNYVSFNSYAHCGHTVFGDHGIIEIPIGFNEAGALTFSVKTASGTEMITVECPDNYTLEIEQMGRIIRNGEQPRVSADFSLQNAVVLDRILEQCYTDK